MSGNGEAQPRLDTWRLVNAAGKDEGMALGNTLGTTEAEEGLRWVGGRALPALVPCLTLSLTTSATADLMCFWQGKYANAL